MPARPWFAFFPGDYLADTAHFSLEEHGAYMKLICHAWTNDGTIPGEPRRLARIWGVHTNKAKTLWGFLRPFWYETQGGFRHKRIDHELAQASELSEKRAQAGRKGGLAKATNLLKQNASIPHPHPQKDKEEDLEIGQIGAFDPPTDKQVIHRPKANGASRFAEWWAVYPEKKKKRDAEKVWRSRHLDARADELIADVKRRMAEDSQWRDGFIPHPTTYLRGERWDDAISQPRQANGAHAANPYGKPIPESET